MIGNTLGPYKILEPLGAGGMGEVYLGEDTRLGRKVAIKVLPEEYAADPERLARFEQEARAAAALNHPHIAVVHDIGFEPGAGPEGDAAGATAPEAAEATSGAAASAASGIHYIVQEYLEGETLRAPLMRGALALDRALALATEIAEALSAAHAAGIIHRDLKPENVFVTKEDHAKVLDFGLAKLTEISVTASPGAEVSKSPTMLGTVAGQVMGTAGYMAPEQVEGAGEIDHRADLFSFGCVVYEMLSGRQPFAGESVYDTLHKIGHAEPPPLEEINAELPAQLLWILKKCLAKQPRGRYQHADDLAVDLRNLGGEVESGAAVSLAAMGRQAVAEGIVGAGAGASAEVGGIESGAAIGTFTRSSRFVAVVITATALALGGYAGWRYAAPGPSSENPTMYFHIELPEGLAFGSAGRHQLDLSRDGRNLVVVVGDQLMLRALDDEELTPIRGTAGGGREPFLSPDGQNVGFWSNGELRRVSISGGTPTRLCAADNPWGTRWLDDGTILYGQGPAGIWRVSENGGEPEQIVELEEGEQAHGPWLLPGGEWLMFALRRAGVGPWDDAEIVVQSLQTGERRTVIPAGTHPGYVSTGHILYAREGVVWAMPFDLDRLETSGSPVPVVEGVGQAVANLTGAAQFTVSEEGTLVYIPGSGAGGAAFLGWIDLDGSAERFAELEAADEPRLSPDGQRIAVEGTTGGSQGVWIYEIGRGDWSLLTTDGDGDTPVWSPDGTHVYFSSPRDGGGIWRRRADFTTPAELVWKTEASAAQTPILEGFSSDGERLFYTNYEEGAGVWVLDIGDEPAAEPLLASPDYEESNGRIHPSGRWIAYISNESGSNQVYVRALDEAGTPGPRRTISTGGGVEPVWSRDGTVIYYREAGRLMAVDVETEPSFQPSNPRVALEQFDLGASGGPTEYDVAADGRILVTMLPGVTQLPGTADANADSTTERVNVRVNWFEELREKVPVGR